MMVRSLVLLTAVIFVVYTASALETDFRRFFAGKAPWDYPTAKDAGDLDKLREEARRDYRSVEPHLKLRNVNTFEDADRHLLFLAFDIAPGSPGFRTDFCLIYVYDRSQQRFVGRVRIPMA